MPVPRRLAKVRLSDPGVDDLTWSILTDAIEPEEIPEGWDGRLKVAFADVMPEPGGLKSAWDTYGAEIVAGWATAHPGTRPSCWWRWSAPEPERRVLAEPEPQPDAPDASTTRWDRVEETAFVETEPAYLRRLDLLLPGEAERIEAADFEPEVVTRTRASWTCKGRFGEPRRSAALRRLAAS
jgi:hypothetical protein